MTTQGFTGARLHVSLPKVQADWLARQNISASRFLQSRISAEMLAPFLREMMPVGKPVSLSSICMLYAEKFPDDPKCEILLEFLRWLKTRGAIEVSGDRSIATRRWQ